MSYTEILYCVSFDRGMIKFRDPVQLYNTFMLVVVVVNEKKISGPFKVLISLSYEI